MYIYVCVWLFSCMRATSKVRKLSLIFVTAAKAAEIALVVEQQQEQQQKHTIYYIVGDHRLLKLNKFPAKFSFFLSFLL